MLANRSMPRDTVIPELAYPDVGEAITWLCDAFGFTLRLRIGNHRAQLNVGGGGAVVLTQRQGDAPLGCSLMVRVEDVNSHHDRACQREVHVIRPPADYPYGERQYSVVDFAGHRWHFSQSLADVDPVEWGGTPGEL
jgi:uncharacterized glyoxalase superfamily protein PhnB